MKTKLIAVPIPAKYKWMATDGSGDKWIYTHKPVIIGDKSKGWMPSRGEWLLISKGDKPKDWRNTLERIVEIEYVSTGE